MNVYFISGLGADKKAFQNIKLPDNFEVKHVEWILPLNNETLTHYCIRLTDQMDLKKPFILIGLSFGGIVVTEFNKILHPEKSIIISSISSRKELPWYAKVIGKSRINSLIPNWVMKSRNPLKYWAFGTKTKAERQLLTQIIKDSDPVYIKWAVNAIVNWKNQDRVKNLVHIHGTKDKIFPIRFLHPDYIVQDGRHFMVVTLADEINEILEKELNTFHS